MMDVMRRIGFGLMVLGAFLLLIWALGPVLMMWPWLRALPLPVRIGAGAAVAGAAILLGSMIVERIKERDQDKSLTDDF